MRVGLTSSQHQTCSPPPGAGTFALCLRRLTATSLALLVCGGLSGCEIIEDIFGGDSPAPPPPPMSQVNNSPPPPPPKPEQDETLTGKEGLDEKQQGTGKELYALITKRINCEFDSHCTRETTQSIERLPPEDIDVLIPLALQQSDWIRFRIEVIRILGWRGSKNALPALHRSLTDQSPEVQQEAAWALSQLGFSESIEEISAALALDPNPKVVNALIGSLGSFRHPLAVEVLEMAYESQQNNLRSTIVSSLSRTRQPEAIATLRKALNHKNKTVRMEALNGLAQIDDPSAAKALRDTATHHKDSAMRTAAMHVLNQQEPVLAQERGAIKAPQNNKDTPAANTP